MALGFTRYMNAVTPESILGIVPAKIFQSLMQGFFLRERADVALIYDDRGDIHRLHRFSPIAGSGQPTPVDSVVGDDPSVAPYQNPFCMLFKQREEQRTLCRRCDKERAEQAMEMSRPGLRVTPCHLGLTEWTYPIRVGDTFRAVVLGGQRIVADRRNGDVPYRDLDRRIEERAAISQREELKRLARTNSVSPEEADSFRDSFAAFCEMIQQTVAEFHSAKQEAATQTVLNLIHEYLSQCDYAESLEPWWSSVQEVVKELYSALGDAGIMVMPRRKSRYVVQATSPDLVETKGRTLPVIEAISWPQDELLALSSSSQLGAEIRQHLDLQFGSAYLYRMGPAAHHAQTGLSMMILVLAEIPSAARTLVQLCCRIIANRSDAPGLLDALREHRENFGRKVTFTGHWLKTPIQGVLFALDGLQEVKVEDSQAAKRRDDLVSRAKRQLRNALFDTLLLRDTSREGWQVFDLRQTVNEIAQDFALHAEKRRLKIQKITSGESCAIRANRAEIYVALSNLMDNAIKYSFDEKYIDIQCLRPTQDQVLVSISNYGIGFSAEDRERLFQLGGRARVHDPYRERPGWGVGLTQALSAIEACGGALDIQTRPADEDARGSRVRYLTTVRACFPTFGAAR